MSQDNPNSLPPDHNQVAVQPVWTRLAIKILRGTIGVLEGVAVKLEHSTGNGLTAWVALAIAAVVGILVWTKLPSLRTPEVAMTPIEAAPPAMITTPPELTSPAPPQPVEIEPATLPDVTPPVVETPPLTPEQNLVATIEEQVMEISDRFASGLIESIQVDFDSSNLTIKVSNDWYTLPPLQQDQLANRMLERSGDLDFTHLEITDAQGKLLARNPVVGNEMVIFKRA